MGINLLTVHFSPENWFIILLVFLEVLKVGNFWIFCLVKGSVHYLGVMSAGCLGDIW